METDERGALSHPFSLGHYSMRCLRRYILHLCPHYPLLVSLQPPRAHGSN